MRWRSLLAVAAAVLLTGAAPAPGGTRLAMSVGGRTVQRMDGGQAQWAYQWPAIYFSARFKGPQVSLRFDDAVNIFTVLVDGRPVRTVTKPGRGAVVLDGLGPGPHTVRLEKRSESQDAPGAFAGFFVPAKAAALPPPPPSPRRIEFIGDSLTVGYGNAATIRSCTPPQVFAATDSQQGFGPQVARRLGAEYQVNAYSGLGMVRNYGGADYRGRRLPNLWPRVLFDDKPGEPPAWKPQVIVIGIGGNDFSSFGDKPEAWPSQKAMQADYERTYIAFVQGLRRRNPQALIVMHWPSDTDDAYIASAKRVRAALITGGIGPFDSLQLPALQRTGCNHHPSVADDTRVAGLLTAIIAAHPGVWR